MHRMLGLALAVTMASAGAAFADKAANAFIDPAKLLGGTAGFTNAHSTNLLAKTFSVGSAKTSGCKVKVQFKGLSGFISGEKMICLAGADACIAADPLPCSGGFGNSIVLHVPYDGVSLKAQTKADFGDVDCGKATDAVSTNTSMHCYKFDTGYDPATLCSGGGGLWVPNPTFVPGEEAIDGLVGLCQYFVSGARLPAPATPLVARDGLATPLKP